MAISHSRPHQPVRRSVDPGPARGEQEKVCAWLMCCPWLAALTFPQRFLLALSTLSLSLPLSLRPGIDGDVDRGDASIMQMASASCDGSSAIHCDIAPAIFRRLRTAGRAEEPESRTSEGKGDGGENTIRYDTIRYDTRDSHSQQHERVGRKW
jgi:hypothetical protein